MNNKRIKQILSLLEDFTIMENSATGKLQCISEFLVMLEEKKITKDEAISVIGFTVFFDFVQDEMNAAQHSAHPTGAGRASV